MINNNEKGQILYASLLPILIVVAIIVGAGFYLFKGEIKMPKFGRSATELKRLEGLPTIVSLTSENPVIEKQRVVIKSEEELNSFLNMIDPSGKLVVKDNINFNKEYLLAVATETNETYGHDIKVKKLYEDKENNSLLVSVLEVEPDDECDEDKVPNVAVDIVSISKTDKTIEFERMKEVYQCPTEESTTEAEDSIEKVETMEESNENQY